MAKRGITLTSLWSKELRSKGNENKERSSTSEIQLTEPQLRVDQAASSDDECVNSQAEFQDLQTASSSEQRFESGTISTVTTENYQGQSEIL